MSGWLVFCLIMAAGLVVHGLLDQRKLWWSFRAWRYRDPEAHEPSDAEFLWHRVASLITAAVVIGVGTWAQQQGI